MIDMGFELIQIATSVAIGGVAFCGLIAVREYMTGASQ